MDLQRTEIYNEAERLDYAFKVLAEAQTILETANFDVAAAYIQMALDQCGESRTLAGNENRADPDT